MNPFLCLVLFLPHAMMDFVPSKRINERMTSYPTFLRSAKVNLSNEDGDISLAQPPTQPIPPTPPTSPPRPTIGKKPTKPSNQLEFSKSNGTKFRGVYHSNVYFNLDDLEDSMKYGPSYSNAEFSEMPKHQKSRFFSLMDSTNQSLQLGVSFTVPFFSIPMESIINFGQTSADAFTDIMNIDWQSVVVLVALVGGVIILLPKLAGIFAGSSTQYNGGSSMPAGYPEIPSLPTTPMGGIGNIFSGIFGRNPMDLASYTNYLSRSDVTPFTSILNQIEEAMKEYDLDSTACMQRVVCSYVSDAEMAVKHGTDDAAKLFIKGFTRSPWIQSMLGDNALTEALEVGRKGLPCQKHFFNCPFSLPAIFKIFSKFAGLSKF